MLIYMVSANPVEVIVQSESSPVLISPDVVEEQILPSMIVLKYPRSFADD